MSVKGYTSSRPEDANNPGRASDQRYDPPGAAAVATKAAWKRQPRAVLCPEDLPEGDE